MLSTNSPSTVAMPPLVPGSTGWSIISGHATSRQVSVPALAGHLIDQEIGERFRGIDVELFVAVPANEG
jgi:hypothetical protein